MFGYVRIYKPQLRICEYESYKAVYCTLCKHLGRQYGVHARMLLNYDYTFVAMLYMALHKYPIAPEKKSCCCNPLKRCLYCSCEDTAGFELTCAMTAEMFYHKVVDNIRDSGVFGKVGWSIVKTIAAPMRRKASRNYPELDRLMAEYSAAQAEVEHGEDLSVDASAEPTARVLSELAQLLSDDSTEKRVLKDFGYYFGRWIYLIDAFDDIEKDIKEGGFNPFVIKFGLEKSDTEGCGSERLEQARIYANECLNMTVARAAKAFDLLELGDYTPIFNNIIYLGLGESQRKALHEKEIEK